MASILLAIKLGTTTTTIFRQGDGLVLKEPSLIVTSGALQNREIKAIGYDAERMIGRTTSEESIVSPIVDGTINNVELAGAMLRGFVRKVCPDRLFKPNVRAIICVPLGISAAEKKDFQKACYLAGINDVTIIPAVLCTAVGQELDLESKFGKLLVCIGGGCTNIAVIANNSIISGISLNIGASKIVTAISEYVNSSYNLKISNLSAKKIMDEVASLYQNFNSTIEVEGIDIATAQPKTIAITSAEVYPIVEDNFNKICMATQSVIESCPADIISDIKKEGGYFSGKCATFPGAERYLKNKLNLNITICEMSKTDIWGAGKLLDNPLLLKKLILNS